MFRLHAGLCGFGRSPFDTAQGERCGAGRLRCLNFADMTDLGGLIHTTTYCEFCERYFKKIVDQAAGCVVG